MIWLEIVSEGIFVAGLMGIFFFKRENRLKIRFEKEIQKLKNRIFKAETVPLNVILAQEQEAGTLVFIVGQKEIYKLVATSTCSAVDLGSEIYRKTTLIPSNGIGPIKLSTTMESYLDLRRKELEAKKAQLLLLEGQVEKDEQDITQMEVEL